MSCAVVIPARYHSTRLPGKVLLPLAGKTVLQHVWERANSCALVDGVWIATDHPRVEETATAFGANVIMTSPDHASGTDRIAEAADALDHDIIVNIQGDEPLIPEETIEAVIQPFLDYPEQVQVATASAPIESTSELFDPNCVKVITGFEGRAIYFSRTPLPFYRFEGVTYNSFSDCFSQNPLLVKHYRKHIGIYAYGKAMLKIFTNLPPSYLEKMEKLEQLRLIEYGYPIHVVETTKQPPGLDSPADYRHLQEIMEDGRSG